MPEDSLITVTDATFAEVVLRNPLPVVVDCWAQWCRFCVPLAKSLGELAPEFAGRVVIVTLNTDENPETARAYRVLSLPALLFFQRGVLVNTLGGLRPKAHLRQALTGSFEAYANR
jgi:thioredoxin 1